MKLEVKRRDKPTTLEKFADKHDLVLRVWEFDTGGWGASFRNLEIKKGKSGAILSSEFGQAETPEEAVADYIRIISGKPVVIDAMNITGVRRDLLVPPLSSEIPAQVMDILLKKADDE